MRFLHQPNYYLICTVLLTLMFTFGCGSDDEEKSSQSNNEIASENKKQYGGTYHVPLMNNPSTLDPAYVNDIYGETLVHQLFDGLVKFDSHLMVLPGLAETWQVEENGRVYRFYLRKKIRFHNSLPVTTRDVKFSLCRLLRITPTSVLPHLLKIEGAHAYRNHVKNELEGLTIIDDHVLVIELTEPHAPFLAALGMYQASIVPEKVVTDPKSDFKQNPIGSGPFYFDTWTKDKSVILKRFSDYYNQSAYLDEIHYRIYPGAKIKEVMADFQKGDLDEIPAYGNIRKELSGLKGVNWFHRPSLSLLFYGMKQNHPLLKNLNFRKALSLSIDREKLVKEVYQGQFEPANTVLPPGMPAYQRRKAKDYNLKEAESYLKKALEDFGGKIPSIEIVSATKSMFSQTELKFIRESWSRIGIDLTVKYIIDWAEFENYLKSDSVQVYRYGWIADIPDPDSFLYSLFASDSSVNFTGYHNEDVDRLLQKARGIVDPVKRVELYQHIETMILETTPVIPLFYLSIDRGYQSSVQGIEISALGAHTMSLDRIWLNTKPLP